MMPIATFPTAVLLFLEWKARKYGYDEAVWTLLVSLNKGQKENLNRFWSCQDGVWRCQIPIYG